jgi:hypothetical protein
VIQLLIELKREYTHQIDTSDQEVTRLYEALKDFPFDKAIENVRHHILTNSWAPKIAQIRAGHGDMTEDIRSKIEAAHVLAERQNNRAEVALPPAGWKEALYAKLGRDSRITE